MRRDPISSRRVRGEIALPVAFLLSGAAGLIFQIVWCYRASLVLGGSLWAMTAVLSAFMAGLALGNALAVRIGRRASRSLAAYAVLEVIVGLTGGLAAVVLPHLAGAIAPLVQRAHETVWIVNGLRFGVAFAVLIVPATAMGATLPLLVDALGDRGHTFGDALARLYGWNTAGAVLGVLSADIIFIGALGVSWTAGFAALLNMAAALLAMAAVDGAPDRRAAAPARTTVMDRASGSPGLLLVCAALSGVVLLALEVIWFRFLSLYVLNTTLAVSLMLAAVLLGIAAGGFAAGGWLRRHAGAADAAPLVAFAAGAAVSGSYAVFGSLTAGTQVGEWWRVLWFALVLTTPTAWLSGVFFTLLGAALHRHSGGRYMKAAARLTLVNTVGAAAGPVLATFVLLPVMGVERALLLMCATYAAIGTLALAAQSRSRVAARGRAGAAAVAALVCVSAIVFPYGATRRRDFARAAAAYDADGSRIVATREGPAETIFLMQQEWQGSPIYQRLVTNGFSMSGTAVPGMRYMRYFAYWPMLMHRGPVRQALVVCYGVGVTAKAVLELPGLESLDVAEISRDIVAMSDLLYSPPEHPLRDPRVRLHLEDGRFFLATTAARYDLITGEPPPPRTPGTVNIYTREYFQLLYDHLAEGGIATYWVPVARPHPGTDVDTVIRAFCDVFQDCSLWNATPFDLMLAGSKQGGGPVDAESFARPWTTPGLQQSLREVGFEQPEQIGATFVGDAEFLRRLTANTPPLTDDYPQRLRPAPDRLSLSDPREGRDPAVRARFRYVLDTERSRNDFVSSSFIRRTWPDALLARTLPYFDEQRMLNEVIWEGAKPLAHVEDLYTVLTTTTLRTLPLWMLGSDDVKQRIVEESDDTAGTRDLARAMRGLSGRDYLGAAALFQRAEARGLGGATIRPLRALALYLGGQTADARQLAAGADPQTPEERDFWDWLRRKLSQADDR